MSLRYVTHVFSVRWRLTIAVMYFEVTDVFRVTYWSIQMGV